MAIVQNPHLKQYPGSRELLILVTGNSRAFSDFKISEKVSPHTSQNDHHQKICK